MGVVGHRGAGPAFAGAHERLLRDARFQFDFASPVPPPTPAWVTWLVRLLRPLAPLAPYLFWATVIGVVGFVLFLAGRELLRPGGAGGRRPKVLEAGGFAPSRHRVEALLAEADRLAAQDRFGEAARVLLLRTLEDIEARRPGLIGPAQTAREIAALQALPGEVRAPLSRIAGAVERFVFAGRPLDRQLFQSCRADYDRFLQAAGVA